jgi:hypothetical protein
MKKIWPFAAGLLLGVILLTWSSFKNSNESSESSGGGPCPDVAARIMGELGKTKTDQLHELVHSQMTEQELMLVCKVASEDSMDVFAKVADNALTSGSVDGIRKWLNDR